MSNIQSLNSFIQLCNDNEKTNFQKIQMLFEANPCKLQKSRHLHEFYLRALYFGKNLDSEQQSSFIELLKENQGKKIYRIGADSISLNFDPIISILKNQSHLIVKSEIVDRNNVNAVKEAACALDLLSYEGVGRTFGIDFYQAIIRSNDGLCAIVKDQNQIIGGMLGTVLEIKGNRIFHFWFGARKANYPGNKIIKDFFSCISNMANQMNLDLFTLSVETENKAINIYTRLGFVQHETVFSSFNRANTHFMIKKLRDVNDLSLPSSEELNIKIKQQIFNILGKMNAMVWGVKFLAKQKLNDLLYP